MIVRRIDASMRGAFYALHSAANECGWCCCVAWWVPTWEGWDARTAEENRALRDRLFDDRQYDGYLAYEERVPIGWCQVGPRDRLEKLVRQFGLSTDPGVWAISCFLIDPARRRAGVARSMSDDPMELWCGPQSLYEELGFSQISSDPGRLVLEIDLLLDLGLESDMTGS